ncbi:MAG: ABC transporter permease, partial [Bacilli bacterium]
YFYAHLFQKIMAIFITYYLWLSIINDNQDNIKGFATTSSFLTYIVLVTLIQLTLYTNITSVFASKIRNGDFAIDLIKPVNLQLKVVIEAFADNMVSIFLQAIPTYIIAIFFLKISLPNNITTTLLFILTLFLSILILITFSLLSSLLVFKTENWWGLSLFISFISSLFSGALFPLSLSPKLFQMVAAVLPFKYIYATPIQIYINQLPPKQILNTILLQVSWIIILSLLSHFIFKHFITKKIFINGG